MPTLQRDDHRQQVVDEQARQRRLQVLAELEADLAALRQDLDGESGYGPWLAPEDRYHTPGG